MNKQLIQYFPDLEILLVRDNPFHYVSEIKTTIDELLC